MTNEQLAELIQDGITELLPSLWEQVEKFFYLQAGKWFYKYPDMCRRAGVELQDLEQVSYFAFLDAVRYYKREEGNKFLSYAGFPIKTQFNELLGHRYEAQTHLPLNGAVNIEKPIGEEDITLLDTLECPAAYSESGSCQPIKKKVPGHAFAIFQRKVTVKTPLFFRRIFREVMKMEFFPESREIFPNEK